MIRKQSGHHPTVQKLNAFSHTNGGRYPLRPRKFPANITCKKQAKNQEQEKKIQVSGFFSLPEILVRSVPFGTCSKMRNNLQRLESSRQYSKQWPSELTRCRCLSFAMSSIFFVRSGGILAVFVIFKHLIVIYELSSFSFPAYT